MVIDELGHTDPALALRVYRQATSRDEQQTKQLKVLVEGVVWANLGERGISAADEMVAGTRKTR